MLPTFAEAYESIGKLWKLLNPAEESFVNQFKVSSFLFKMGFIEDYTDATKTLPNHSINCFAFYSLFSKSLLRIVVIDVMNYLRAQASRHLSFISAVYSLRRKAIIHTMRANNPTILGLINKLH